MPSGTASLDLRSFEILKPFEVQSGLIAPAFGDIGGGTQFLTPITLETLLKREIIKEITPK